MYRVYTGKIYISWPWEITNHPFIWKRDRQISEPWVEQEKSIKKLCFNMCTLYKLFYRLMHLQASLSPERD